MLKILRSLNSKTFFHIFLFTISLTPFFVLPFNLLLKDQSRFFVLAIFSLIFCMISIIRIFKNYNHDVSLSRLDIILFFLSFWYCIALLFSIDKYKSFVGIGVNIDSVFFVFIMSLVSWIISFKARTRDNFKMIVSVFMFSMLTFVFLVNISLFLKFSFGTSYLDFFISNDFVSSFNDLLILDGLLLITFVVCGNYAYLYNKYNIYIYLLVLFLIFSAFFVNFSLNFFGILIPINILLIIFLLLYTRRTDSFKIYKINNKLAFFSLIILIALSFFRVDLNTYFSKIFNIEFTEINLTWSSNFKMIGESIKERSLIGFGPNTSNIVWEKVKPTSFNLTDFWSVGVRGGSSYLVNVFVNSGLIGFLIFSAVLFFSVSLSIKSIKKYKYIDSHYGLFREIVSVINIYLAIILVFYNPNFLVIYTFFIFLGLLMSVEKIEFLNKLFKINLKNIPYLKLVLIFLLVIFIFSILFIGKSSVGSLSMTMVDKIDSHNLDDKIRLSKLAVFFDERPEYLVVLSRLQIAKAKSIFFTEGNISEIDNNKFNFYIQQAISNVERAYFINKNNYDVCIAFGDILFDVGVMGGPKGFDLSFEKYLEATQISPNNPLPLFLLAKSAFKLGKHDLVKKFLTESIKLKINYAEAYFLLAINDEVNGDIQGALNLYDIARKMDPNNDFFVIQYLAFLYRNGYKDQYHYMINSLNNTDGGSFVVEEVDSIKDDKLEELLVYLII